MGLTTDPSDSRLDWGADAEPGPPNEVYLVLSEEQRAQGFVRPVRRTYIHQRSSGLSREGAITDFLTEQSAAECGGVATTMATPLAETYARDPTFYGATYCVGCKRHLRVEQFDWEDGSQVGS